jgi:peptidyl-prolyl cis-trans isomerase SurA
MKILLNLLTWLVLLPSVVTAQDEVLITIAGQPVMRSEFERVYHKNNKAETVDPKMAEEYLNLFVNFKLKVLEARHQGYDTMRTFLTELSGYRDQLAKPYLQNRQVVDQLVQEAYEHSINEVNASHIMVKLPANPTPEDTLKAYQWILEIRKRVLGGEPFSKVAQAESEDPSARENEGRLGWFSAFMMVYPFEKAAYSLPVGDVSMPVRSRYGYHIITVNGIRPALGEVKLAHIMTRGARAEGEEAVRIAREKITKCYDQLNAGKSFEELVPLYSEDAGSARNGGLIRWIKSGELPANIEEVVFHMKDSGTYTVPLQSDYGWHIFRLLNKRPIAAFDKLKSQLEERILSDDRGKIAEQAMNTRIIGEAGYTAYKENLDALAEVMDSAVYIGSWKPESAGELLDPVCTIGGRDYSQKELADYITMTRRYNKAQSFSAIVTAKFDDFVTRELRNWEKSRLEDKYPEFRYLMEEYHDGILLFNITDQEVWSKAVKDTIGLSAYFNSHRNDYQWKERADVSVYTVRDALRTPQIQKMAKKRTAKKQTAADFITLACGKDTVPCVTVKDGLYEKGDTSVTGSFSWKKGMVVVHRDKQGDKLVVVNRLVPPGPKELAEVRGQATADYQNELDRKWIAVLREKYPVVINREVLQHVR